MRTLALLTIILTLLFSSLQFGGILSVLADEEDWYDDETSAAIARLKNALQRQSK